MRGSKNVDISKFKEKKDEEDVSKLARHHNSVSIFSKTNKVDKWYYKQYGDMISPKMNEFTSGKEAAGSDFFRFILGKKRAAKTQAAYNPLTRNIVGVISQHNHAGFETFADIRKEFPNDIYPYGSVEEGLCEVKMAETVLDDIDGTSNDGNNAGLNDENEVSRIDFDFTFFLFQHRPLEIRAMFEDNELLVNQTENETIIKRFYISQIKTALLTPSVISTILDRHFKDSEHEKLVFNFLKKNIRTFTKTLLKSDGFKTFIADFDYDELRDEIEDFFKHERKYSQALFDNILTSIEETFNQLKSTKLKLSDVIDL